MIGFFSSVGDADEAMRAVATNALSSVVLPDPLGPISTTTEGSRISELAPSPLERKGVAAEAQAGKQVRGLCSQEKMSLPPATWSPRSSRHQEVPEGQRNRRKASVMPALAPPSCALAPLSCALTPLSCRRSPLSCLLGPSVMPAGPLCHSRRLLAGIQGFVFLSRHSGGPAWGNHGFPINNVRNDSGD